MNKCNGLRQLFWTKVIESEIETVCQRYVSHLAKIIFGNETATPMYYSVQYLIKKQTVNSFYLYSVTRLSSDLILQ